VLGNPRNHHRAIALTYDPFRFAFANAVPEDEARQRYEEHAVPAPGLPIFQAATANINPWTEAKVAYRKQRNNPAVTEITEIAGRGHSLTSDGGWRDVADTALSFVQRFA